MYFNSIFKFHYLYYVQDQQVYVISLLYYLNTLVSPSFYIKTNDNLSRRKIRFPGFCHSRLRPKIIEVFRESRIRSRVNILDYNLLSKWVAADPHVLWSPISASAHLLRVKDPRRWRRAGEKDSFSRLVRANEGSILSLREIAFLLKPS